MSHNSAATRSRPSWARARRTARLTAIAALAILCVAVLIDRSDAGADQGPTAAVQQFVAAASVLGNGYRACTYLTPAEQRAVTRRSGAEGCRQALNAGGLVVGGDSVDSTHALHGLSASARTDGDHAWVRLSHGGQSVSFRLVNAGPVAQDEYRAPATDWRIADGALALLHGRSAPAGASAA